MRPQSTTFQSRLAFGEVAESAIANWLRSRGSSILPIYEIEADRGKGPRMFSPAEAIIAPDMLVFGRDNSVCWIEAKHKTVFSWHRKTSRWVTGIDLHHYENYLAIADRYPYEIWLMFLHKQSRPDPRDAAHCPPESPVGLFSGKVSKLRDKENHRHWNHGKGGMVYWARESLMRLATLEEINAAVAASSQVCPDPPVTA